jgi:hypothetical protein
VIQKYTRKSLTVETDRLTAILGLAKRFERLFDATFLAGLWAEDLHRGLLWRDVTKVPSLGVDPDDKRERKKRQVVSPSWSWVNCGAPVEFEWDISLSFPTRIHPVARILSDTDAEFIDAYTRACKNKHRGSESGSIQLWGVIKRVRWLTRTVHLDGGHLVETGVPVPTTIPHTFDILKRRTQDSKEELPCVMDYELKAPLCCYCAIIADWTFEDSWKEFSRRKSESLDLRCYLVLQRIQKVQRHRNPSDLGYFKRIGVGAASIRSVKHFFGLERKYFLTLV